MTISPHASLADWLFLGTNLVCLSIRAVTDSINQLITMCTQQAPGQKECDNALRELEVTATLLHFPAERWDESS